MFMMTRDHPEEGLWEGPRDVGLLARCPVGWWLVARQSVTRTVLCPYIVGGMRCCCPSSFKSTGTSTSISDDDDCNSDNSTSHINSSQPSPPSHIFVSFAPTATTRTSSLEIPQSSCRQGDFSVFLAGDIQPQASLITHRLPPGLPAEPSLLPTSVIHISTCWVQD